MTSPSALGKVSLLLQTTDESKPDRSYAVFPESQSVLGSAVYVTIRLPLAPSSISCIFAQTKRSWTLTLNCLLETSVRHHGPIRKLLANNTRAQCHLQLLPLNKGPH
ncbi:hypothetical protein JOB18_010197 [Solea senegalensis]|uniref:Uncharacterized protein n=1 Tax=Solea senegalensis TaxID=28829 RepID=A0AAV6QAQ1_SOLSE|nr:hypothetical protein JOB18_010197 [Solea senegalensis]